MIYVFMVDVSLGSYAVFIVVIDSNDGLVRVVRAGDLQALFCIDVWILQVHNTQQPLFNVCILLQKLLFKTQAF